MKITQTQQCFAAAILLLVGSVAACATVETKEAVVVDDGPPPCTARLSVECDAGPPDPTRCTGDKAASDNRRFLPSDRGYSAGCFAYFQQLDCSTDGYCYCAAADAGTAARWICP